MRIVLVQIFSGPLEYPQNGLRSSNQKISLTEEFETDEKRLVFMKSCVGLINGLFKTEWQAHV